MNFHNQTSSHIPNSYEISAQNFIQSIVSGMQSNNIARAAYQINAILSDDITLEALMDIRKNLVISTMQIREQSVRQNVQTHRYFMHLFERIDGLIKVKNPNPPSKKPHQIRGENREKVIRMLGLQAA